MYFELTLKLVGDGPTNGRTLSRIELLSKLKNIKNGQGGSPNFFPSHWNTVIFFALGGHAKFQSTTLNPYGVLI